MKYDNKAFLDFDNFSDENLELLNSISLDFKFTYNELIDDILKNNPFFVNKFSSITSRNNHQCELFDICIKIIFVEKFLDNKPFINKIYTSNYILYKFLQNKYSNIQIKISFYHFLKQLFFIKFNKYLDLLKNLMKSSINLLNKSFFRTSYIFDNNQITLIDTFFYTKDLKNNSLDRNYTNIQNFLNSDEKNHIYYVPSFIGFNFPHRLKLIRKGLKLKPIFKHDFLTFQDYINAFFLLIKQSFSFNKYYVNGKNISFILNQIHTRNKFNSSTYEAILNYLFIERLLKKKIDIKLFISWFENQPIDKGYIYGLRHFYPKTKIKGYQGLIVSFDYNLHLIPSNHEIKYSLCPDEIVLTGTKLAQNFTSNLNISIGPAFRFNFIKAIEKKIKLNSNTIMILLPAGVHDSLVILKTIFSAFKNSKINIKIKPHPLFKISKLNINVSKNINYNFVYGNLLDNLLDVSVVLGTGSSALIESLVNFTPAIVISKPNALTQNPIPKNFDHRLWKEANNKKDIIDYTNYFIKMSKSKKALIKKISLNERKNFFTIPNKKNVRNFLDL